MFPNQSDGVHVAYKATSIKLNKYKRIDLFILVYNNSKHGYNDMFVEYSTREVRPDINHVKSIFIPKLKEQGLTYMGRLHEPSNSISEYYVSGLYCFEVSNV